MSLPLALLLAAAPAAARTPPPDAIDRATWITADDYPAEALKAHMQGAVAVAVEVDVEGNVASCRVTKSSGHALLDETTCRLMKARGHYRLLRDEHSRPIPFQMRGVTNWRLPTAAQGRERPVRFSESATGTTCLADYDGKDIRLPAPTCTQITTAIRARGETLDRPATVWLPDGLVAGK